MATSAMPPATSEIDAEALRRNAPTQGPLHINVPPLAVMKSAEFQEQIRCRAYQLCEQDGRKDGHEPVDWLQAEAEVARQKAKAVTA